MELRLILGDQLNARHSWFADVHQDVTYVLMEVHEEATYVTHHIQKILCFFAAMRQFAADLQHKGHTVLYYSILQKENRQSITSNLAELLHSGQYASFAYLQPDEYRVESSLQQFTSTLTMPVAVCSTEHFLVDRNAFEYVFPKKASYLMETFYRYIRKKENLLLDEGKPLFGKWNFDVENRKKLPLHVSVPEPLEFENQLTEIYEEIKKAGIPSLGEANADKVGWPINRSQALSVLAFFCDTLLPLFGTYQDAMTDRSWAVFHSRLSFALNCKLLSPREVIDAAVSSWQKDPDRIDYNQLEGFVRQIAGWREYMRCLYWAHMPGYASMNHFNHENRLPAWYWTGETHMHCLSAAIRQSLKHSYAHHIQRLMVTGNFALLAGVDPDEVDRWYLGIYIDAIEWVEITNTRGMSQYADGGLAATKPYVSSAAYIDKMSDYCASCRYKAKQKTGEGACPFNSLYWHFLDRHREKLATNQRMTMMYAVWDKMHPDVRHDLLTTAAQYLENLDAL